MPTETIHDKVVTITSMLMTAIDSRVSAVTMNGITKTPISGVVDLGTVLTAHQSLSGYVPWVEDIGGNKVAVTIGSRQGAVGAHSLANGNVVEASGNYSHAEGNSTIASGYASHTEGDYTEASGYASHAEGDRTIASGECSHAEGSSGTEASGIGAHAEGYEIYAKGPVTHAEGFGYTIPGSLHPSGEDTHYGEANGMAAHMEGVLGTANGLGSHVEVIFASDNGHTGTFVWQGYVGEDLSQQDQEYLWDGSDGGATRQQVMGTILAGGQYNSHGVATFNGNPKGGLSGFYIGEQNLASILSSAGGGIVEVEWADLTAMVSAGQLIPGNQYRIIDYNTTTVQDNTQAAGHQFDIIVVADSVSTLNETARAIRRENDTYFLSSNLAAWEIKYCLYNDTSRFAWADEENGKGVVYYMKDEWNNECWYDFKNIMFQRMITLENGYPEIDNDNGEETWVYTFTGTSYNISNDEWSDIKDGSLEPPYEHGNDELAGTFYNNSIEKYILLYDAEDEDYTKCGKQYLNDNVFLGYWYEVGSDDPENWPLYPAFCSYGCKLGVNCHSNTFNYACYNNSFGNDCYSNSFGGSCINNSFGNDCYSNSFENSCHINSFGGGCRNNSFGDYCFNNSFGNNCYSNSFGKSCQSNSFGNDCTLIRFGTSSSIKGYYNCITVESGNQRIYLNCTTTTSSSQPYRNVTIKSGVNNTNNWKTISDSNVNQTFNTTYQPANSQVISI